MPWCTTPLRAERVGGEFVGIRHRSIFGSREPRVPREVVAMASTSALDGPWGPVRRRLGENSQRYLRVRRARWNSRIVDGLSTIAERITRAGRMNSAHTPARIRSDAQRFGARCRERFRMSSCCLTKTDPATTDRRPPGPISRARVAIRCTSRMIGSRIGTSSRPLPGSPNLIISTDCGLSSNSPPTGHATLPGARIVGDRGRSRHPRGS